MVRTAEVEEVTVRRIGRRRLAGREEEDGDCRRLEAFQQARVEEEREELAAILVVAFDSSETAENGSERWRWQS